MIAGAVDVETEGKAHVSPVDADADVNEYQRAYRIHVHAVGTESSDFEEEALPDDVSVDSRNLLSADAAPESAGVLRSAHANSRHWTNRS